MWSDDELVRAVRFRDARALARVITLLESRSKRSASLRRRLYPLGGKAHVVGITGSPGAGKSSLVDRLAVEAAQHGKRVGIIAVDPSSPFSGGAVLGDRIRMQRANELPDVFIRSMASRGALGGLSQGTLDVVIALDAAGYDLILIETVGVGQGEVDVVRIADTCVVVLAPGMGDEIQALKAGILEIADVFAVNKADRDGTEFLLKDIRTVLGLVSHQVGAWDPPVVPTIATENAGVADLMRHITAHRHALASAGALESRRKSSIRHLLLRLAGEVLVETIANTQSRKFEALVEAVYARTTDPRDAARKLYSYTPRSAAN